MLVDAVGVGLGVRPGGAVSSPISCAFALSRRLFSAEILLALAFASATAVFCRLSFVGMLLEDRA